MRPHSKSALCLVRTVAAVCFSPRRSVSAPVLLFFSISPILNARRGLCVDVKAALTCCLTSFAEGHGACGYLRIIILLCLTVMVGSILPVLALVGIGGAIVTLPMTPSGALIWIVVCCRAPE